MLDRFETFATTIVRINRYVQKIKSMEMSAVGLRGTHVMCLYSLGKAPEGLTAARLCEICGEDKAAISRTVSELVNGQYITAGESGKRAYRARLRLTEKGRDTLTYINERVDCALDSVGEDLSDRRREDLYDMLAQIETQLRQYVDTQVADKKKSEE